MNATSVVLLLLLLSEIQCARILGIFPMATKSHFHLGSGLMKGLAEKGHDVTLISPYVEKNPPKNGTYRDIVLTGAEEEFQKHMKNRNMFEMGEINVFILLPLMLHMLTDMTESVLNHPNVQELLNSDEKFDLVILEQFLNEAHKGIAAHFNAPLIVVSSIGANSFINHLVGNPAPPSYVPDTMLSYSSNMTFCERTVNTLWHIYAPLIFHLFAFPSQKALYDKYFPNGQPFYDIMYNVSLIFLNSHPSINQPVPYVPNMIDIGGYHIQPSQDLPNDLQKLLDEAPHGVIYFSLGSHIPSSQMAKEKIEAFIKTFSKLKYTILWKWEEDVLPGKPANVEIRKWFPQQDLLAHPNIKLFITHAGLLSTTETIYHGVPVLAIPIGGDQKLNAQRIRNEGIGLSLSYQEVSEATLTSKLEELLSNPKYAATAKKKSELFHDRIAKPMDTAAYWVDYVIRHGGAPHLRVAGVNLKWYSYLLLDVIVFLITIVLISAFVGWKITKFLIIRFCSSKNKKHKQN